MSIEDWVASKEHDEIVFGADRSTPSARLEALHRALCLEHGGRKFLASICLPTGAPAMELGGLWFMPYAAYATLRREVGL